MPHNGQRITTNARSHAVFSAGTLFEKQELGDRFMLGLLRSPDGGANPFAEAHCVIPLRESSTSSDAGAWLLPKRRVTRLCAAHPS